MKNLLLKFYCILICLCCVNITNAYSQEKENNIDNNSELIALSKQKWQWMADLNIDLLKNLFHEKAVFVHMGATMNKEQEINTIKSGGIQYKHTEIQDISVRFINNTAIVLDKIRLTAIVGGNEVINPFMVTEVYIKIDDEWNLGALSFTRTLE